MWSPPSWPTACDGISFALDDFGAGYTAFRYFRDFFFDMIKIDGQFIRGIASNPDNQVLTQALASIGKHFDMFTVAESVETPGRCRLAGGDRRGLPAGLPLRRARCTLAAPRGRRWRGVTA
jgi:predicted signal transduction protein with EAL and GGDEF domain